MSASSMASSREKTWGRVSAPSPITFMRASSVSRPGSSFSSRVGSASRMSMIMRGILTLSLICVFGDGFAIFFDGLLLSVALASAF